MPTQHKPFKKHRADNPSNTEALGAEQIGLLIARFGNKVDVEALSGDNECQVYRCHLRAKLAPMVAGDRVTWQPDQAHPGQGVVTGLLPHHSLLVRTGNRGQPQPIAANVDRLFIVIAPQPAPQPSLIDRYLVAAEAAGIEPMLLLNKIDLLDQYNHTTIMQQLAIYQSIGYPLLETSSATQLGLEKLQLALQGYNSVLVGQSGVGKSSLLNVLLPNLQTRVGALTRRTGRGAHTTTRTTLFHCPHGGSIIDSPGISEFMLVPLTSEQITAGFKECRPYCGDCKFRNCQHDTEPGCALRTALAEGKISEQRFASLRALLSHATQ